MPAPTEATAIPAALEFSNWAGGGILLNMPTILNFPALCLATEPPLRTGSLFRGHTWGSFFCSNLLQQVITESSKLSIAEVLKFILVSRPRGKAKELFCSPLTLKVISFVLVLSMNNNNNLVYFFGTFCRNYKSNVWPSNSLHNCKSIEKCHLNFYWKIL